jgi:hypothetical protein
MHMCMCMHAHAHVHVHVHVMLCVVCGVTRFSGMARVRAPHTASAPRPRARPGEGHVGKATWEGPRGEEGHLLTYLLEKRGGLSGIHIIHIVQRIRICV